VRSAEKSAGQKRRTLGEINAKSSKKNKLGRMEEILEEASPGFERKRVLRKNWHHEALTV